MASWRDNLLEASLDGVVFLYEEVHNDVGRRVEVTEFPGRDDPHTEDLGRLAHRYNIRAYVLGENYADVREQLIEVLESPGDHDFQHPYRGVFTVKVDGVCRIVETVREGRMAVFDIPLVESGLAFPQINLLTPAKITKIKTEILSNLASKTKFSLFGAIGAVLASISNGISTAASKIRKVNGKIGAGLGRVHSITQSINELEAELDSLVQTPDRFIGAFVALGTAAFNFIKDFTPDIPQLDRVIDVPDFTGITLSALEELDAFVSEADGIPTPTDQSALEQAAHLQLTNTMKVQALADATDVLASLELDSADKADTIIALLAEKFEAALNLDLDDEVHQGLMILKSVMVEHFTAVGENLPRVRSFTPPSTMPALVIACELYDDADQVDDIIKRNNIRHPLFVAGGRAIEVLSEE